MRGVPRLVFSGFRDAYVLQGCLCASVRQGMAGGREDVDNQG